MMFVGYLSRLACFATGLSVLALYVAGPVTQTAGWAHHHVYLLAVACLLLAMTDCGRSYSIDRLRAVNAAGRAQPMRDDPLEYGSLLGQRLIALQLSAMYFWTAIDKTDRAFLSGERLEQTFTWIYSGRALEFRAGLSRPDRGTLRDCRHGGIRARRGDPCAALADLGFAPRACPACEFLSDAAGSHLFRDGHGAVSGPARSSPVPHLHRSDSRPWPCCASSMTCECPFCSRYAAYQRLREEYTLHLVDARAEPELAGSYGLDLNEGMIIDLGRTRLLRAQTQSVCYRSSRNDPGLCGMNAWRARSIPCCVSDAT